MSAIEMLQELLDSLPEGHADRPGVRRAIEVLRVDGPTYRRVGSVHEDPRSYHTLRFRQGGSVPPLDPGIDYPVYIEVKER